MIDHSDHAWKKEEIDHGIEDGVGTFIANSG
jgi:hypothetical protein